MVQLPIIQSLIVWQKRLDIEEERRKQHRSEPYVNYLAAVLPCCPERRQVLPLQMLRPAERGKGHPFAAWIQALVTYLPTWL